MSLEGPLTLERVLDEVKRGPTGPFIEDVQENVVDGQPALWVAFAPGAQFQLVVGVIAPDRGDGQYALVISASDADRELFETLLGRLRFLPM